MWGLERERERGKGFARKERALRERRGGRAENEGRREFGSDFSIF